MNESGEKENIAVICRELNAANIIIDKNTVRKISVQGFNSAVYEAETGGKKVIVHVLNPVREQLSQAVDKKLIGVSKLLEATAEIPSAEFFHTGILADGRFIFAQEKLPGENWGRRKIENGKIVDKFYPAENKKYLEQLNVILARQHQIKFEKYGWLKSEGGKFDGAYGSWEDFLLIESALWLKNIFDQREKGYVLSKSTLLEMKKKIEILYSGNLHLFESEMPALVHGDMINPGNILIEDGKISGIIDYEWALAGDPAWEFAYTGNSMLSHYFDVCDGRGVKQDR